jgi:hypothetical protein
VSRLGVLGRRAAGRWRVIVAWATAAAVVGGVGYLGYRKLLEGGWIKYNEWDRRDRGTLQVGHRAPDLELPLLDEGRVRLAELWRERPVVLVFGSCT